MRVVAYKPKHYTDLVELLTVRGVDCPPSVTMPKYGYVAIQGSVVVAMAFIRRVEGGYAQLDGLVSNSCLSASERHQGIDLVVSKVMEKAKSLGITTMTAASEDEGTIMRSQTHGFKKLPMAVLVVDLNNWRSV